MKNTLWLLLIGMAVACQTKQNNEADEHSMHMATTESVSDTVKGSPHRVAMADVGNVHVHIEYNAPTVRKRIIWGGLVPFQEVWVSGAHHATSVSFSRDVILANTRIPKGKYAFFTIPDENEWTLILNRNWKQHLTDDYSEKEDVLRWKVKPDTTPHTERLTYTVLPNDDDTGVIELAWEKVKISIPVQQAK